MSEALIKRGQKGLKPILATLKEKFNQATPKDVVDLFINAGVAYYGARSLGAPGILLGPLGLKLATADTGSAIPVTQGAGLALLSTIAVLHPDFIHAEVSNIGQRVERLHDKIEDLKETAWWLQPPFATGL